MIIRFVARAFASLLLVCFFTGVCFAYDAYIPHITGEDADWNTYLLVDYLKVIPESYNIRLYNNGEEVYNKDHTPPPFGEEVINLKQLAPTAQCGKIVYSSEQLNFRVSYENTTGGGLAEFSTPDLLSPSLGFYFSDFSSSIAWKGIALANLGVTAAEVKLYAMGGGKVIANTTASVPAQSRIRGFYTQWFPEVDFSSIKKIIAVSSGGYLTGISISGDADSARLLFTTASAVSDFDPGVVLPEPGNMVGTWVGTWRSIKYFPDSGSVTFHVETHTGGSIVGTLDVTESDCGEVSGIPFTGEVISNTVTINATHTCNGETSTLQYTQGTVVGDTFSGVYNQLLEGAAYDNGTFTTTKQ